MVGFGLLGTKFKGLKMKLQWDKFGIALITFVKNILIASFALIIIPLGCVYIDWNHQTRNAEKNGRDYATQHKIPFSKVQCQNDYSNDGMIDCEIWDDYKRVFFVQCSKYRIDDRTCEE